MRGTTTANPGWGSTLSLCPDPQDGHGRISRGPDGDPPSRSRPGLDHVADPAYTCMSSSMSPPGPPTAKANAPRSPASSLRTRRTGSRQPAPTLERHESRERFFASQVRAGGPMWPHGAPTPRRSFSSQKPDNCPNAANSWIPANGRSRTRTWDLFLIRKTVCPLQSPQLALNPCKTIRHRLRKGTGEDWRGQPGGPTVAPRPPFESRVSYGPEADITPTIRSGSDAPEAGRGAPA